jgi:hypothetical protein
MRSWLTLTFRDATQTGTLESRARELGARLQKLNSRITGCHMTFSRNASAKEASPTYAVKIHVALPGAQVHADSAPRNGVAHADPGSALRDAYESARRQVTQWHRERLQSILQRNPLRP